jgi:hypothetical protein
MARGVNKGTEEESLGRPGILNFFYDRRRRGGWWLN